MIMCECVYVNVCVCVCVCVRGVCSLRLLIRSNLIIRLHLNESRLSCVCPARECEGCLFTAPTNKIRSDHQSASERVVSRLFMSRTVCVCVCVCESHKPRDWERE